MDIGKIPKQELSYKFSFRIEKSSEVGRGVGMNG